MPEINIELNEQRHVNIVLGSDKTFSRSIAINMLPSSKIPNAVNLMSRILEDEEEIPRFRHLSAANLWRVNTTEASDFLLNAARRVKDTRTLNTIIKYLGRVGDEGALEEILELMKQKRVSADVSSFAASLISYRLGIEGHNLPIPRQFLDMPGPPHIELKFTKAPRTEVDILLRCLSEEPYGIELSEGSSLQIRYPGGQLILMLNRDLAQRDSIEILKKRKTLMGLLATKDTEYGRYSASYLIFTSPNVGTNRVDILITRVTGEVAWAGMTTAINEGQASFITRTVGRIGITPMELEGTLSSNGRIQISKAVSATKVSEKRHPHFL